MKHYEKSAAIYRFKLPIRGYGYCQVININGILLVHVYDFFGIHNRVQLSDITANKFLMNILPLKNMPVIRGYGAWKLIGEIQLNIETIAPDYKYASTLCSHDQETKDWYVISSLDTKTKKKCSYTAVKHLEYFHFYTPHEIEYRTSMEILKREQKKIKLFFDMAKEENLHNYYRTKNVPLYEDIQPNLRGKIAV